MNEDSVKLSKSIEDYMEVMYNLNEAKGVIRVVDIADELNIKPPSVVEALDKISKLKLVTRERYGEIKLTKKGVTIAKSIIYKHITLKKFLTVLGVDDEIAEKEACLMEHFLSDSTIEKFKKLTDFVDIHKNDKKFKESFIFQS
ncbi:MAG: metal-dependent transcriptional regulator [Methanobacterium sp.]|nr:metal-dependent transcriptional regulator [Methanobacterium sp.]